MNADSNRFYQMRTKISINYQQNILSSRFLRGGKWPTHNRHLKHNQQFIRLYISDPQCGGPGMTCKQRTSVYTIARLQKSSYLSIDCRCSYLACRVFGLLIVFCSQRPLDCNKHFPSFLPSFLPVELSLSGTNCHPPEYSAACRQPVLRVAQSHDKLEIFVCGFSLNSQFRCFPYLPMLPFHVNICSLMDREPS